MADVGRRAFVTLMFVTRLFVTLLGGAASAAALLWPLPARAQQAAKPVIGFLDPRSPEAMTDRLRGFRQGLKETGYVEEENVTIVYRWAENHVGLLPALADDLVGRKVALIVASGGPGAAFAAKAATTTIPTLFLTADDPVRMGLVASLARPGGNLTGINFLNRELASKQLEILRELVPHIARLAALVAPANTQITEATLRDVKQAAGEFGMRVQFLNASTSQEIDTAFATLARDRPDALFVGVDPFLNSRRVLLSLLATRHGIPAIYSNREFAEVGALLTYGSDIADAYRQVGIYAGRILKGAKPTDLPVVQSTKLELVVNSQTARILGLTVPPSLLATADEVIE
jgi:putative tryptophan/tyrosine transport system substrate-binding protein